MTTNTTPDIRYTIALTIEREMDQDDECYRYLVPIEGKIYCVEMDEYCNDTTRNEAGRLSAYLMLVEAAENNGEPIADYFDSIDQNTFDAFCAAIDIETGDIHESIQSLLNHEAWSRDLLFVDKMEIRPEHRGHGLGLQAMRHLLELYGDQCGIVIAKPYPMYHKDDVRPAPATDAVWHTAMQYALFEAEGDGAAEKLSQYWQQVGFVPIPNSSWHVWRGFRDDANGTQRVEGEG
jgi:GNAT superfamily N-acetyltransferase